MIKDVEIKEIKKFTDDRGWLMECQRSDVDIQASMLYVSHTNNGVARGPHEHIEQTDFFVMIGPGDFEFYLWDNREYSETFGEEMKFVVGESNPVSILVPPGVVHGYKSISEGGSFSINTPDRLYKGTLKCGTVDEIRHEKDINSKFKIL